MQILWMMIVISQTVRKCIFQRFKIEFLELKVYIRYNVNNVDIPGPVDYRLHRCGFTCPRNFPWLGNPLGQ